MTASPYISSYSSGSMLSVPGFASQSDAELKSHWNRCFLRGAEQARTTTQYRGV